MLERPLDEVLAEHTQDVYSLDQLLGDLPSHLDPTKLEVSITIVLLRFNVHPVI